MTDNARDPIDHVSPDAAEPELTIEDQRAALADTVAALAAKADVSARVQLSAQAQVQKARTAAEANPQIVVGSLAAFTAILVLLIVRKRRHAHQQLSQ